MSQQEAAKLANLAYTGTEEGSQDIVGFRANVGRILEATGRDIGAIERWEVIPADPNSPIFQKACELARSVREFSKEQNMQRDMLLNQVYDLVVNAIRDREATISAVDALTATLPPVQSAYQEPKIVRLSNDLATQLNVPYNSNLRHAIEQDKLAEPIAQAAYIRGQTQGLRTAATQETVKR